MFSFCRMAFKLSSIRSLPSWAWQVGINSVVTGTSSMMILNQIWPWLKCFFVLLWRIKMLDLLGDKSLSLLVPQKCWFDLYYKQWWYYVWYIYIYSMFSDHDELRENATNPIGLIQSTNLWWPMFASNRRYTQKEADIRKRLAMFIM